MSKHKLSMPDYKKIYTDMLNIKFPEKKVLCYDVLMKRKLSVLDVIKINALIFGPSGDNQKHRSYTKAAILEILYYQKIHRLNNTQLALHFNLSRNTVAKWKKFFFV